MYKHIFFLLLLTFNILFHMGKCTTRGTCTPVSEPLFCMHFNSAITLFILYNTLDVPLSANSVVTLHVSSRGWSFLRVVFSQTRNFTVTAFTGWIYCIEIFFTLSWKTEFAVKLSTVFNIFFAIRDFWATCACLENRVCSEFTVLNIHFLSFRIFEQLALALKQDLHWILCIEYIVFYHSGFLRNLRLPWKTRVALISCTVLNYFYHLVFLSNLRLSWKQSLSWIHCIEYISFVIEDFWATCSCPETFQAVGAAAPPRLVRLWCRIVTSQTVHAKYKWPPYATEWNSLWKFTAYATDLGCFVWRVFLVCARFLQPFTTAA